MGQPQVSGRSLDVLGVCCALGIMRKEEQCFGQERSIERQEQRERHL